MLDRRRAAILRTVLAVTVAGLAAGPACGGEGKAESPAVPGGIPVLIPDPSAGKVSIVARVLTTE